MMSIDAIIDTATRAALSAYPCFEDARKALDYADSLVDMVVFAVLGTTAKLITDCGYGEVIFEPADFYVCLPEDKVIDILLVA